MGNNPSTTNNLRLGNGDRPYQVDLAESVVIHFSGREFKKLTYITRESWELSYKVHNNSSCRIILTKLKLGRIPPHSLHLSIEIVDDAFGLSTHHFKAHVDTKDSGSGLLRSYMVMSLPFSKTEEITTKYIEPCFTSSSTNNALETRFYFYGSGTRIGLIIWEEKKMKRSSEDNELKPYTATMTHYYANTENGETIGLSVALKKIRVVNGDINFDIDGPEQHPASALLYMFDEIRRTKTWKATYCPHCAYNSIQRQRRAGMWQSESESDADNNDIPIHGRRRNPGSFVSNNGRFSGTDIGNTYISKYIAPRRTW